MELRLFISKIHVILYPCSLIETGAECMQESVFLRVRGGAGGGTRSASV